MFGRILSGPGLLFVGIFWVLESISFFSFLSFFLSFCFSRAAPAAYGDSQARGLIGAIAAGLSRATATQDPSRVCDLHHSSWQPWIPNPLSKARDQIRTLMVPSQIVSTAPQWELLHKFLILLSFTVFSQKSYINFVRFIHV